MTTANCLMLEIVVVVAAAVYWLVVDSSWNVMAHGDAQEENWRGNSWMEWVANTLHSTSEHDLSSITTADAHTSATSSRLNWRPHADLNGLVRFARKTKSVYCACAITFQLASTGVDCPVDHYISFSFFILCSGRHLVTSALRPRSKGHILRCPGRVSHVDHWGPHELHARHRHYSIIVALKTL